MQNFMLKIVLNHESHFGRHTLAVTLWQSHFSRHISTRDVEVLKNTGSTFEDDTKHIGYQVLKDIAN